MINIKDSSCTGCAVCSSICPTKAISFKMKAGFSYPAVDNSKCIECGECERKCPALNHNTSSNDKNDVHVYAAWSKNKEQRKICTSGGICFELSRFILKNNGCVAGVVWSDDYKDARYELIDNMELLPKITQTKYFQPKMNDIYKKIKIKLEQDIKVLFIGTACTNAGLKSFLAKDYDNLFCCDFICRGYTSQEYHSKRIEYLEKRKKSNVCGVQYKNKDKGWTHFGTKFYYENGDSLYVNRNDDPYEIMFKLEDLNTRPCCYDCRYRTMPRLADITVGDFWTINGVSEENLKNGISAVFTFNRKGKYLFNSISDAIVYEERSIAEVSNGNYALLHQIKRPCKGAEEFYKDLKIMDYNKFNKKYASKSTIRKRNFVRLVKRVLRCNLFYFFKINYLSKEVIRKKNKFVFPYYGAKIDIKKDSEIIVNENIIVNSPKHKNSNEQTYLLIRSGGKLEINGFTNVAANSTIDVLSNGKLVFGEISINYGTTIICSNNIVLGNGVDIGRNVTLYDSNFHPTSINNNKKLKPLIIKDHVWICSGVTIAKGVTIGENAICGINATVIKNVKSGHMVMGNPAKDYLINIKW